MRVIIGFVICIAIFVAVVPGALATTKPHVISFGKTMVVPWFVGAAEDKKLELKIRPLYVDTKLKEFTTGEAHDITDRMFVVRRAYRINDALPQDSKSSPRWKWQRGGWLLVDRLTGRVSQLNLPQFDAFYSAASWYRDYVAYCGISDSGDKVSALVAEIGRKKPLLNKPLGAAQNSDQPDSQCEAPTWQRPPVRVTFTPKTGEPVTFSIRGQTASPAPADEEE
ncbi:MAG: hypothetical protein JO187_10575 [Acidobacteria bacterium]|nr:hypothetical protein [Acidobacteriota bacterium]